MTEVLFYHLQDIALEAVLPPLLERSLERRWKVIVQAGSPERVEAIDALLWTYRDDSFLPHGVAGNREAAEQPILLTAEADAPNGAEVRFLLDDVELPANLTDYLRVVVLFDGRDADALASARAQWQQAKAGGHEVTYWQRAESGRWERQA